MNTEYLKIVLITIGILVGIAGLIIKFRAIKKKNYEDRKKKDQEIFKAKIGFLYHDLFENQFSEPFDQLILINDGFNPINIYKLCSKLVKFKDLENRFNSPKTNKYFNEIYAIAKNIIDYVENDNILVMKSVFHPSDFSEVLLMAKKEEFIMIKERYLVFYNSIFGNN